MESSVIKLCELINELVDGSQVLQYFYMTLFGCLIMIAFLFLLYIILCIPVGIASRIFLDNCDSRSANKIREYKNINIFNCWKYIKNGRKE